MPRRARQALVAAVLVVAAVILAVLGTRWLADEMRPSRCVFQAAGRTVELTPEQAANAATISGVAVRRGLPPRASTIALATAIQESKLRNLTYGHADSEGLFQQRPSQGWGTREQVKDPVYASGKFYDALVRVPDWQDGVITEVAQAVQRSAYPEAYAQHEWEGRVLASILTGQEGHGTVMGCELDVPTQMRSARTLAATALAQTGVEGAVDTGDNTLTLRAGSNEHAWALATWAVARAEASGVERVQVDRRVWTRDRDPLRWRADRDAPAGPTTVVVHVH